MVGDFPAPPRCSLCHLCVLCVSVVSRALTPERHREHRGGTEEGIQDSRCLLTTKRYRPSECGISSGSVVSPSFLSWFSSASPPNKSNVDFAGVHSIRCGTISSKRSRARQVTKSTEGASMFSKRSFITLALEDAPACFNASRRNTTFFCELSIKKARRSGLTMRQGSEGSPPPAPTSASETPSGKYLSNMSDSST